MILNIKGYKYTLTLINNDYQYYLGKREVNVKY